MISNFHILFLQSESETARETAKREAQSLGGKLQEVGEELRMREKELTLTNEDARKNENKNGEKLKNLENLLDNVNQVSIKIIVLIFNFKDIFGILYTKIFLPNLAKLYFSLSINQSQLLLFI